MRELASGMFRVLASVKLAVVLLVLLGVVLAVATIVEANHGRDFVRWYVYGRDWFIALLGLLGVNILSAALVRFPWKRRHFAFLVAHAGLLVLLVGAIQTFLSGIDGSLSLEEGQVGDSIELHETSRIRVEWLNSQPRSDRLPAVFTFRPGPVNWPEGMTLDLGEISGVKLAVKQFFRHARSEEDWIADESKTGVPALKFTLIGVEDMVSPEAWLVGSRFGSQTAVGSARVEFQRAPIDSMVEDFLQPPAKDKDMDKDGLLAIHCEGKVQRIPVSKNIGKKISLPADMAVEIAEYLPNARPKTDGKFVSQGTDPQNPMLELRVHLPGKKEPMRQIAFAASPFLTMDGIHGRTSPVKFWYHHPAVAIESGIEFLATSDGKLYCRVAVEGKYLPRGEVKEGARVETWSKGAISLVKYLPHAKEKVTYYPLELPRGQSEGPGAAAQIEVTAGGVTRQVWLTRGGQQMPQTPQMIDTPEGRLAVGLDFEELMLGFALRLTKFTRGLNPGGMGDASFASSVQLLDGAGMVRGNHEISMNEPLVQGRFTFYQSGILPSGNGTVLSVAYDPGRFLKYVGSLMICLGSALMFYARANIFGSIPSPLPRKPVKESPMRSSVTTALVLLGLSMLPSAALADAPSGASLDWKVWRALPVQDGGRHKPMDSLAWESCRMIANRASFTDPETKQKLDATAFYLTLLLDWQGWDASPRAASPSDPHAGLTGMAGHGHMAAASVAPDKWDRCPLIVVDSLDLRKALGMAEDQKYIAPADLSQAEFRAPHASSPTRFLAWTQKFMMGRDEPRTTFEKQALELAGRLRTYQDLRAGRRLEVAPISGAEDKQWASLQYLMRAPLDDKTDPSGSLRKVKEKFQAVRAAYQSKSSEAFRDASLAFIATVNEVGPKLGAYPSLSTINLEVAYNHWVPFRFAWVFVVLACLCVLVSMGTGWKPLYVASFVAYGAGLIAMCVGFAMRTSISGRAPVTNMYESVVYVGLGVALLGLIFELIYRKRFILVAAAVVSTVALVLADNCPALLDPSLQPLQPVLRNNFWLVTHVMTITLSYAAFALALGIGNITLGYFLVRSKKREIIEALSRFTYRTLQVGVVLLAAGTVLGGVWADYSWGRFWGWDPKEVWALIALLGYLAVLHARFVGWVGHRGLAALSILCFSLVVVAWYGVNFVLGAGLHSYGFGGGGQSYVAFTLALQFAYVALALIRSGGSLAASRMGELPSNDEPLRPFDDARAGAHPPKIASSHSETAKAV